MTLCASLYHCLLRMMVRRAHVHRFKVFTVLVRAIFPNDSIRCCNTHLWPNRMRLGHRLVWDTRIHTRTLYGWIEEEKKTHNKIQDKTRNKRRYDAMEKVELLQHASLRTNLLLSVCISDDIIRVLHGYIALNVRAWARRLPQWIRMPSMNLKFMAI